MVWSELQAMGYVTHKMESRYDEVKLRAIQTFWTDWGPKAGFFSAKDNDRILDRHLFESLVCMDAGYKAYEHWTRNYVSRETECLDLGSGPGIPGLVAIAHQTKRPKVTLQDSSRRRLSIVEDHFPYADELSFVYRRAEENQAVYALVFSRAFVPFPGVLELATCSVMPGGLFIIITGKVPALLGHTDPHRKRLQAYIKRTGFVSREIIPLPALQALGARHLLIFQKNGLPAPGYPRTWKRIKESSQQWVE
ncbi:MAG: class I SAM-dependent methyltransferase [Leptospiraceae bacterium]|nr:class I SAM-dependent methyltransferase [Leptospiraceae bacterium]